MNMDVPDKQTLWSEAAAAQAAGRWALGVSIWQKLISLDQTNWQARANLICCLTGAGLYADAIAHWRIAKRHVDPDQVAEFPVPAMLATGNFREAMACVEASVRKNPDTRFTYWGLHVPGMTDRLKGIGD